MIELEEIQYRIIDAIENLTIADSFVVPSNKTGAGHGDAKFYVGKTDILDFFEEYQLNCFILKKDLQTYLDDCEEEYLNPSQEYKDRERMAEIYVENRQAVNELTREFNDFTVVEARRSSDRVYISSESNSFGLIRRIALPNISYISIYKLQSENETILYFRPFVKYLSLRDIEETKIEKSIAENTELTPTEKDTIIKARVGQGKFRKEVLQMCPRCPITSISNERLLVASHIKPWRVSNNTQKIDPNNGFALSPTYDKLFDMGLISFENDATMLVSRLLSSEEQEILGIFEGKTVEITIEGKEEYLDYHRSNIYKS